MVAHTTGQTVQNIIEYFSKENEESAEVTGTKRLKTSRADMDDSGEETISRSHGHRYDLPFVLTVDDGVAPLPAGLPLELNRGFFGMFASPPSLITIFAWISSSLAALTFLGQNNVTNLRQYHVKMWS